MRQFEATLLLVVSYPHDLKSVVLFWQKNQFLKTNNPMRFWPLYLQSMQMFMWELLYLILKNILHIVRWNDLWFQHSSNWKPIVSNEKRHKKHRASLPLQYSRNILMSLWLLAQNLSSPFQHIWEFYFYGRIACFLIVNWEHLVRHQIRVRIP